MDLFGLVELRLKVWPFLIQVTQAWPLLPIKFWTKTEKEEKSKEGRGSRTTEGEPPKKFIVF